MRKPLVPVLALVCAASALAAGARAQERTRRGGVEVGLDLGWTGFGTAAVEPNGGRLSVYGAWYLTPRLALVADITCLGGTERVVAAPSFTMCTGNLGGAFDLRAHARLVPYLRLGIGQTQLDRGAQAGVFDIEEKSVAFLAGAGARWYLGRTGRVALRGDALWTRTDVFGDWAAHTSIALGVIYRFGANRSALAP